MSPKPLLQVRDLRKYFPLDQGLFRAKKVVRAVDGVSFDIFPNETLSLVGESGCGKTTVGRSVLRLIEPTEGSLSFDGVDLCALSPSALRALRPRMQIIFQDPFSSLNPRMTVESLIGEALKVHGRARGEALRKKVEELLERVGLQPSYRSRYPHEFSGGQRQRIGIARALALEPDFIVCDEAVSALDVSVQAQVLNLLRDLQQELGLAYLFISHDLSVVRHISDRVAVMYLGQIVEIAETEALFDAPAHPYSLALLSALPQLRPGKKKQRLLLEGDLPSPVSPPSGCRFHTRCPFAYEACSQQAPELLPLEATPHHKVACHLAREGAPAASVEAHQEALARISSE